MNSTSIVERSPTKRLGFQQQTSCSDKEREFLSFIPLYPLKTFAALLFTLTCVFSSTAQNITVTGGLYHSTFLCSNGNVYTSGENASGQLGDGTTTAKTSWTQVLTGAQAHPSGFLDSIQQVDAGSGLHNLALDCEGHTWSWGRNFNGQLGNGTTTDNSSPVQVLTGSQGDPSGFLTGVTSISASNNSSSVILSTREVMTWGKNSGSELGDGTTTQRTTPVYVLTSPGVRLTDVEYIDAGDNWSLAIKSDKSVWIWGSNTASIMNGYGTSAYAVQLMYDGAGGSSPVYAITVSAGDTHGLFVDLNGNLWSWGGDWAGQLGYGGGGASQIPVQVTDGTDQITDVVEVAASNRSSLALTSDGTVYSFGGNGNGGASGNNNKGQLGDALCNSTSGRLFAATVTPPTAAGTIVDISEGDTWSFLIDENYDLFGFGENLRTGAVPFSPSPFGQGDGTSTCILNTAALLPLTLPCASIAANCVEANLGDDQSLCSPGSIVLSVQEGINFGYQWFKDGSELVGATSDTLFVNSVGSYSVVMWDSINTGPCGYCAPDTDTVVVTSTQTTTPNNGYICDDPCSTVELSVTGSAGTNYDWYDAATGGTKLNGAPNDTYTTACISATTHYYVQDLDYVQTTVGYSLSDSPPLSSQTISSYVNNKSIQLFDAISEFTFDSVTVRYTSVPGGECSGAATTWTLNIEIEDNVGGTVATVANTVSCTAPATVKLFMNNETVPVGTDYRLKINANANFVTTFDGGATYPQSEPGVLDITRTQQDFLFPGGSFGDDWGPFFDWVISTGNSCGRTPVLAELNCALPPSFIDFDARQKGGLAELSWSTLDEIGVSHYVILKSSDGVRFTAADTVLRSLEANSFNDYNYIDVELGTGTSYYQVVQVTYDKGTSTTPIKAVHYDAYNLINIYPNPFASEFMVSVSSIEESTALLTLTDLTGKQVLSRTFSTSETLVIGESLARGAYIARVRVNHLDSQTILLEKL